MQIINGLKNGKVKTFVIDDSQYLIAFEGFARAKEKGYDKHTEMFLHFQNLINFIITQLPEDIIVYFLHHTEITDAGKIIAKTYGKMMDNQLTLEGLFAIVLLCDMNETEHYFETQGNGRSTAKSPMGMFDFKIDNDLKLVDTTIRNYYELNKEEK